LLFSGTFVLINRTVIELRQLKHFLAVVEEGGIRQAARRIPLSPSSVARSVQMLETHYGEKLLVRRGKQVDPTAFGRQLATECRAVIERFEGIGSRLGQVADLSRGTLRLGMSPAMAGPLLPIAGAKLLREHPGVSVETRFGHAVEVLGWLVDGEIDLAGADAAAFRIHGGLAVTEVLPAEIPTWVRRGHPLLRKPVLRLGDLVDYPVISQYMPGAYRAWFESLLQVAASERGAGRVNHAQQCTDYAILFQMAESSDAILHAPVANVLTSPWADRLERLDLPEAVGTATFAAVTLEHPPAPPLARRFIELLQEAAEEVQERVAAAV
jgi:DNA-binding transcriptional LysR family regulator